MNITNSYLWKTTLEYQETDSYEKARTRLRATYEKFWENAVTLSREIQKSVPALTLHDDTHFEALWDRADQIAGENFELNPLEAFVFGGAILIHDAANSVAAYEGGISEIMESAEWSDAEADWLNSKDDSQEETPLSEEDKQIVLLNVLRSLHAVRAESLCFLEVKVADNSFYLLPDDRLRAHLGNLIGKVAASHHWDIEDLPKKLQTRVGAPAGFPREWAIRPILLAGLLRCADAVQLDQSRTPDFLFGLLKLNGLSEKHWQAQNKLATPIVDPKDKNSFLFTSTQPYHENDSSSWWIAYDSIAMANAELVNTNALLRDLHLPPFKLQRITNANSPVRLSKHVETKNWEPVPAKVYVGKVNRIVDMFGGSKLYGKNPEIALRELIQNAADSIKLRRSLEPSKNIYSGRIDIILKRAKFRGNKGAWLIVEDDGIGMSEAVLTGPLIDFGGSYLSSNLVKSERPGLIGKRVRRSGKFGIGFFSVFMLGEFVQVSSRPFDEGVRSSRTIVFNQGIDQRPLLSTKVPSDLSTRTSTRVSVFINQNELSNLIPYLNWQEEERHKLSDIVAELAPMLDVDTYVTEGDDTQIVHHQNWNNQDPEDWLKQILAKSIIENSRLKDKISELSKLIQLIDPEKPEYGRAAIQPFSHISAGMKVVDGLRSGGADNEVYDNAYIGAISFKPTGPSRIGEHSKAPEKIIQNWATQQAKQIAVLPFSDEQKFQAACAVAELGGNPEPISIMYLNRRFVTALELFNILEKGISVFAQVSMKDRLVEVNFKGRTLSQRDRPKFKFSEHVLEPPSGTLSSIAYLSTKKKYFDRGCSFISVLDRIAKKHSRSLELEYVPSVTFGIYTGTDGGPVKPGTSLTRSGVKLSLAITTGGEPEQKISLL